MEKTDWKWFIRNTKRTWQLSGETAGIYEKTYWWQVVHKTGGGKKKGGEVKLKFIRTSRFKLWPPVFLL